MYFEFTFKRSYFVMATICLLLLPVFGYWYLWLANHCTFLFPPCGMQELLHLYCPACGGTRAMKYLLHLDILGSLLANPLVLYMVICIAFYWVKGLRYAMHPKQHPVLEIHNNTLWGFLWIMLIVFVLRNILLVMGYDNLGELQSYWSS